MGKCAAMEAHDLGVVHCKKYVYNSIVFESVLGLK